MFPLFSSSRRNTQGFSLVEVMVAMVIGLLGMIVMLQVYSNSERLKSATSGGNEAQNTGAIALYGLQRDVQQSGWGFSAVNPLGCSVQLRAGVTLYAAPVTINPVSPATGLSLITGQDANTDTLLVIYGNSNGGQEGDTVTAAPPSGYASSVINTYAMASIYGFNVNDMVVAETQTRPIPCNLVLDQVTAVTPTPNVTVNTGLSGMTNGALYNLGQTPRVRAYAIRGGNLTVCDYMTNDCGDATNNGNAAIWVPIAENIVNMQAVYGHDTVTPTPGGQATYIVNASDKTAPTTGCGWLRTPAVGIALVARNSQAKQGGVTTAAPTWGLSIGGPFTIDLSADANWQSYRYKVFQTVVPIRNVAVQGVQSACSSVYP